MERLFEWANRKIGPASTKLNCEDLGIALHGSKYAVAFFGEETDDLFTKAFSVQAESDLRLKFYHTDDKECARKSYHVETPDFTAIAFFREFESFNNPYDGPAEPKELLEFYQALMIPHRIVYAKEYKDAVLNQARHSVVLFRNETFDDYMFIRMFYRAANEKKGKNFIFVEVDGTNDDQKDLMKRFGVKEEDLPLLRIIKPEEDI